MGRVATDGVSSQNFWHWLAEMRDNWLLDSAKPEHIEPSDRSPAKKIDDGYQCEGCQCWTLSGLILYVNCHWCYFHCMFELKFVKYLCFCQNQHIHMQWIFMQTRQRIFKCIHKQVCAFARQNSETFLLIIMLLSNINCRKAINSPKQSSFLAYPVVYD